MTLIRLALRVKGTRLCFRRFQSTLPELPPLSEWSKRFPSALQTRDRISIHNPKTAEALIKAFGIGANADGPPHVIIEAYPGAGLLTRTMLSLPPERVKKIIVLEDNKYFLPYLLELQEADPRVTVIKQSGYDWDAYSQIEDNGLLDDVEQWDWEKGEHPQLRFVSGLPNNGAGEQLLSQLMRSIPERQWLFKYGKVPLHMMLSESLWERMSAPAKSSMRCKLGVICEAAAHSFPAVKTSSLHPIRNHVFPFNGFERPGSTKISKPLVALNIYAKSHQTITGARDLEVWDFCLRKLFVLKSRPFEAALPTLAPGATSLLEVLRDRIDVKKPVRELEIHEWAEIIQAFNKWPFAPTDLYIPMLTHDKRLGL